MATTLLLSDGKHSKAGIHTHEDPRVIALPDEGADEVHVLEALRVKALRLGMPYQTLISSVLHRYISGELSDEKLV